MTYFYRFWHRQDPVSFRVQESPKIVDGKLRVLRPVPKVYQVSSPFGKMRTIDGISRRHNGIDFACPEGTRIKACADGWVFRSGWENEDDHEQGYGLRVWQVAVIGGITFYIWYGHMNDLGVEQGDTIKQGQILGLSGNTGRSTGPHLHFGAREENTAKFYDMEFY